MCSTSYWHKPRQHFAALCNRDAIWKKKQNKRFSKTMTATGNLRVSTYEIPNRNHGSLIYKISKKDPKIVQLIPEFIWKKQQKVYIIKRIKKAQEMHLELLILSMK
jgi:hypothetical protein